MDKDEDGRPKIYFDGPSLEWFCEVLLLLWKHLTELTGAGKEGELFAFFLAGLQKEVVLSPPACGDGPQDEGAAPRRRVGF